MWCLAVCVFHFQPGCFIGVCTDVHVQCCSLNSAAVYVCQVQPHCFVAVRYAHTCRAQQVRTLGLCSHAAVARKAASDPGTPESPDSGTLKFPRGQGGGAGIGGRL